VTLRILFACDEARFLRVLSADVLLRVSVFLGAEDSVVSGFSRTHTRAAGPCVDAARRVLSPILFRPSSAPKALVTSTRVAPARGRKTIGATRSRLAGAVNARTSYGDTDGAPSAVYVNF